MPGALLRSAAHSHATRVVSSREGSFASTFAHRLSRARPGHRNDFPLSTVFTDNFLLPPFLAPGFRWAQSLGRPAPMAPPWLPLPFPLASGDKLAPGLGTQFKNPTLIVAPPH